MVGSRSATSSTTARRLRELWPPGVVWICGVALSLMVWHLVLSERRANISANAESMAVATRQAIEAALDHQMSALAGVRDLWSSFGLGGFDRWEASVGHHVDRIAGLESIRWVELDGSRVRGFGGDPGEADLEDIRAHASTPHIAGPMRDASGVVRYRISLPTRTPEGRDGVVVGDFRVDTFLNQVLSARARGYAVALFWGDEEIFSRGEAAADRSLGWWDVEQTVKLPIAGSWRVTHRPTAALAATWLTPTPHYLLALGLLLSAVLAGLVQQLRANARQARVLFETNRVLESRVFERTEALQDAVAELEAFNYSVSHDLRSPLGAIQNFAAIIGQDYAARPLDGEGRAMLVRIQASARRATALLEDLLQLSRAGRAALNFERIDMTDLAHEALVQVLGDDRDRDVDITIEPLPEASGDRALIGGVFANLFSNALKYSRGCKERRIVVRGWVDGVGSVYEVADTGHGFDTRYTDKLFELFERLHADDGIEGTGVGLAMVARIVKRHGGAVFADGQPGKGARFSFLLPNEKAP